MTEVFRIGFGEDFYRRRARYFAQYKTKTLKPITTENENCQNILPLLIHLKVRVSGRRPLHSAQILSKTSWNKIL